MKKILLGLSIILIASIGFADMSVANQGAPNDGGDIQTGAPNDGGDGAPNDGGDGAPNDGGDSNDSGSTGTGQTTGNSGSESGLVSCGVSRDCTICDLFILARDVFNFALGLLAAVAVLSMVIGGFYMVLSTGNMAMYRQGLTIVVNSITGILLVGASFLLFSFMLTALGFQSANFDGVINFQPGQFFEIECDNQSYFDNRGTNGRGAGTGPGSTPTGDSGVCGSNRCGDQFASQIESAAAAEGIDPKLLQALIDTENANGTNCATDKIRNENDGTQSCGLFQLNTGGAAAACGISCQEALDVDTNLRCAAQYLKAGNATTACAAANRWNPGACSTTCQDLAFTYCSRNVDNYEFYSQCAQQSSTGNEEDDNSSDNQ